MPERKRKRKSASSRPAASAPSPAAGGVLALLAPSGDRAARAREALLALGTELREHGDPDGALTAAEERAPELVVLDAAVRTVDIGAFAAAIRAGDDPAPPLLVLLDEAADPAERFGERAAIRDFLAPPFTSAAVRAYAAALLAPGAALEPLTSAGTAVRARRPTRGQARELHQEATQIARRILEQVRARKQPSIEDTRPIAERIHTELLRSNALVLRALEPHGPYDLPAHCANVAVIAGKLSLGLGFGLEGTIDVIQAGLVHDVGMARLPHALVAKEGALTTEEYAEVRRHPDYASELIGALGSRYDWLRRAVHQEHERANGQGYPQGLRGQDIDPIAQLLGVADVFEALTHPRSYRSPFTAFEALQQVVGMQEEYFPRALVSALVNEISSFPLDSYVQLDTGEIAQVVRTNPDNLMRPEVLVLWDAEWRPLGEPRRIDLADVPGIAVARALREGELPIT